MKYLRSLIYVSSAVCGHAENANDNQPPVFIQELVAIKFPKISAEDATLSELIDFIANRLTELDPHKPGGISFFFAGYKDGKNGDRPPDVPSSGEKKVNYSVKNVSLTKVLTDVAKLFDIEFHVTSIGVVVTPSGGKPFPNLKAEKGDIYYSYKSTPGKQGTAISESPRYMKGQ